MIDFLELLHQARHQITLTISDETLDDGQALVHRRNAIEQV